MTQPSSEPVLAAIARSATEVTGAAAAWLVGVEGDRLVVRAVAGEAPASLVGSRVAVDAGAAGYVISSGQPLALASRAGDPRASDGLAAALGRPPGSVVCVPCEVDGAVLGALELVDKSGGGNFSFDDVELANLLAGIAGVALGSGGAGGRPAAPSPSELAAGLARLAAGAPARYTAVAEAVAMLVADDGR